jgi:PAS domain S-box-containing protein
VAALAGRLVALSGGYASPLWPAAGVALVALMVFGRRCWPGLWLGAFLVDLGLDLSAAGAAVAAINASGATLQALLAAGLTRRLLDAPAPLTGERHVARFLLLGGPLACLVSASISTAALLAFGKLAAHQTASHWLVWWAGDALGVLLFAPLALLVWPGGRTPWPGAGARIALPLLVTAALLAAGNLGLARKEESQAREAAAARISDVYDVGFPPLTAAIEALQGLERFFAASREVTREEFAVYTRHLLRRLDILSADWAPRVPREQRAAFEAQMQREGIQGSRIFELGGDRQPMPAGERAEYFPVMLSEPANPGVLGLDHGYELARRAAMARARDGGAPAAAATVFLLRTHRRATLVYVPVYRHGFTAEKATVDERRSALRGFVVGVIDHERLFAPLAREAEKKGLLFRISDVTPGEPAQVLADTLQDFAAAASDWHRSMDFAGRVWRLEMRPAGAYWQAGASIDARLYLALSVLAAFMVAFATLAAAGRYAAAMVLVDSRTAALQRELQARRMAEAALSEREEDLDVTLQCIGDGVLATDIQGRIRRMNPVAEALTGWALAEARGRPVDEVFRIINEQTRRPAVVPVEKVLRTGEIHGLANHTVLIARDGRQCAIADSAAPIRDAAGAVRGVVLVFRDVTQERAIERALQASEARYRRLVEFSPYGVFVQCDGRFAFLNPRAVAMLGAAGQHELLGRKVEEWVHPDNRAAMAEHMRRLDEHGIAVAAYEAKWLRLDGSVFHGEASAVPYEHEGRPGALVLLQDVTARKEAEAQLDRFFALAPDLLCIAGTDGYFKRVNPAFRRTLGWDEEELLARPFLDFVHPEDRAATLREVEKLAAGQPTVHFENRYRCKDGSWRWLDWRTVPQSGGVLYAAARDITWRREASRLLEEAKAEAEAASRAKSAFLATMSHEIRTPMNGVIGLVEVLTHSHLSEHQADLVRTIRESATALLGIIDDILDFSKIEAGRLELERVPVAVVDLVEGLCDSLIPVAARGGVELRLFVSPAVPEWVVSDEVRLRQILYNLLGNAIKFSAGRLDRPGRVSVQVEVAAAAPLRLAFRVADNGIGMAPEIVRMLFTPFTQGEVSTTRRFGGSGLGLAICKRLVDLMQGEIAVESTPGRGSTFTVTLPFDIAAGQPLRPAPDLHGIDCIVVASPDLDTGHLCAYLEHAGARVHRAADGTAAAPIAAALDAPVVIHDAGRAEVAPEALRAPFASVPNVRHVVIGRGRRRRAQVEAPDWVALDADGLRRHAFLRAVAVAAGRASPEILRESAEDSLGAHAAPPSIDEARARGRLILVAEDDETNRKVIQQQLALLGYAAEVAGNGRDALELWRRGHHALLLTDLHMPEMDGYALAEAIRREEAGRHRMPILALTANALRGEANHAYAAGMDEYLTKPVQLRLLKSTLERWLPEGQGAAPAQEDTAAGPPAADTGVDVTVLKGLVGDDMPTVLGFLRDYLASLRRLSGQLRAAFAAGDTQQVGAIAHKLKSSSRSVGALGLAHRCDELESAVRSGDRLALERGVPQFETTRAQVEAAIEAILAGERAQNAEKEQ